MSFNRTYTPRDPDRIRSTPTLHDASAWKQTSVALPVTASVPVPKVRAAVRKQAQPDIRGSARGEACTVRLEGICNFNPETTVWSHYPLNDGGKGMGMKSVDLIGCYCCSACHDVVDGRRPRPAGMTQDHVLVAWFKGMVRSLLLLKQKGLL